MELVVFLRGVNVGGRKTFRPAALAKELAALDVVNVGAAGTFVVRKAASEAKLRAELVRRLPFQAELMICRAGEVRDLVEDKPFGDRPSGQDRPFVSVVSKRPRTLPRLPLTRPPGDAWQVKVIGVSGKFVLSVWRRGPGRAMLYPNEVVEKTLGLPSTTRNWNTISAIYEILQG